MKITPRVLTAILTLLLGLGAAAPVRAEVAAYPEPQGVARSADYAVTAGGKPIFISTVETLRGGPASYGGFDCSGPVEVEVRATRPVSAARLLPLSYGITPRVDGSVIRFTIDRPGRNLTLELNGAIDRPLHLFANPMETNAPRPGDPGVVYFGPGVHEVTTMTLRSGQTLYLAGGAVLRAVIGPGERPTRERDWSGVKNWRTFLSVRGQGIAIRGRGVIDFSALPWHARSGVVIEGSQGVAVEGITILDAPAWAVSMWGSREIRIDNIKQICRRENSDGIDVCNSQNVRVSGCFMRNNDDEICVKCTMGAPAQISKDIRVEGCVIWNERARGLGITSETRRDIEDVVFQNCDIIHDFSHGGDCAALAILVSDSGTMRRIRFEDIRVHDARVLVRCWVGQDMWGHDAQRGAVEVVIFKDIKVMGELAPRGDLIGFGPANLIRDVTFQNLVIRGQAVGSLAEAGLKANEFVKEVRFTR